MTRILLSGLVAGVILSIFSIAGLYITLVFFPTLALQYFDPAFRSEAGRNMIYYVHPFIVSIALSFFWNRFKGALTGSFIAKGLEFGLSYTAIAILPMMLLIYSAFSVSALLVLTWFIYGLMQGIVTGFVFEKMNP